MDSQKIINQLKKKYSVDDLAKLVLKYRNKRSLYLILIAYIQKSAETLKPLNEAETDNELSYLFWHYMLRVYGPGSWLYKNLSRSEWDNYEKSFKSFQTEQEKKIFNIKLAKKYISGI
jgi:hypothetical protein